MNRFLARAADAALEATIVASFTNVGYRVRRSLAGWQDIGPQDGRTFLVTGATSGLGRAAAGMLAERGGRVVMLGRDPDRTAAAAARIGADHVVADLADLSAVRRAAAVLRQRYDRLDALVNNAGALTHEYVRTPDGLELTHQTHVVAPFLLTHELLPLLQATPASCVVTVSSGGMYTQRLQADQMGETEYDGVVAYARAKRAQVVLNREWAARRAAPPAFQAMHPGWADTPGVVDSLPTFHRLTGPLLRTAVQGADTMVWLAAVGGQQPSGGFWHDRRPRGTVYLPWTAGSPQEARELWERVARQAGISAPVP